MTTQYLTPIPQEQYQSTGLITAVVGFFLLAYFFMYDSLTQLPGRLQEPLAADRGAHRSPRRRLHRSRPLLPRPQRGHLHVICIAWTEDQYMQHHFCRMRTQPDCSS